MRILGIETSCDETAIALVDIVRTKHTFKIKVLKNFISSQIAVHRPFGGVVPNLAKREHALNLPILFKKLNLGKQKPDAIVVTVGPGLEPALWTGINFAKTISKELKIPLIGANHLEGHLYSFLLSQKVNLKKIFPAAALVVSGGHTILLRMDSLTKWKRLGETRDDAAGEAFDKVARMLKLSYPGGPEIERLAKNGNPKAILFPRPMIREKGFDFSFAGLKTSVFYYLRDTQKYSASDVATSFQEAVVDVLVKKTMRAAKEFGAKSIFLSGGVASNALLRKCLRQESKKIGVQFLVPQIDFNTDNAVMIAVAGYMDLLRKKKYKIFANANINL